MGRYEKSSEDGHVLDQGHSSAPYNEQLVRVARSVSGPLTCHIYQFSQALSFASGPAAQIIRAMGLRQAWQR